MEGESAIYAEIAAGGTHIGEFYEELARMGRTPDEIEQRVQEAQAALYTHTMPRA